MGTVRVTVRATGMVHATVPGTGIARVMVRAMATLPGTVIPIGVTDQDAGSSSGRSSGTTGSVVRTGPMCRAGSAGRRATSIIDGDGKMPGGTDAPRLLVYFP